MTRINIKAIGIGLLAGIVVGGVVAPLDMILFFGSDFSDSSLRIWSLVFGGVGTALGAFLAAWYSQSDKGMNVLLFGTVNEVLGLVLLLFVAYPLWYNIASALAVVFSCIPGWYVERLVTPVYY